MAVIYLEVTVRLSPLIPWREVMIAEMGSIGFEGFEETSSGFKAYIPKMNIVKNRLNKLLYLAKMDYRLIGIPPWTLLQKTGTVHGNKILYPPGSVIAV